ncbi:MAG: hypothetical protein JKY49_15860 [Cohaesibacteraceae bacterium]|nr:hypothetical protein [Cohaesibacteraceae bacterium]MBL4876128.1 hypothetical protein [Cohaesibacteraceae bacterium]
MVVDNMIKYVSLIDQGDLPKLGDLKSFTCIILIGESTPVAHQLEICKWLVDSGCKWIMAFGQDCEIWHDTSCSVVADMTSDTTAGQNIMTTSHRDQTIDEVLALAKLSMQKFDNILMLDVGEDGNQDMLQTLFDEAQIKSTTGGHTRVMPNYGIAL